MSKPILSIVIATRNRAEYAIHSIQHVLSILSEDLQLVVQDNSDNKALYDECKKINDSRLIYNYTEHFIPVAENFNVGLSYATGKYVTIIGDDDGVNPEIMEAVRWAQAHDIDAVTPSFVASYLWPDFRHKYTKDALAGTLIINQFSGKIWMVNPEDAMLRCAIAAGQSFGDLPKLYYGFVKRECIEKVLEKTGTRFPAASPDMASAMGIASFVKRVCRIDYPLYVPGSSAKSTAGTSAMKQHVGRLRDQPHLPHNYEDNWPIVIPKIFTVQTIWAESAYSTLRATGREDILQFFNIPLAHAACAAYNPQYFGLATSNYFRILSAIELGKVHGVILFMWNYLKVWGPRIKAKLKLLRKNKDITMAELDNIDLGVKELSTYLAMAGYSFTNLINNNLNSKLVEKKCDK